MSQCLITDNYNCSLFSLGRSNNKGGSTVYHMACFFSQHLLLSFIRDFNMQVYKSKHIWHKGCLVNGYKVNR